MFQKRTGPNAEYQERQRLRVHESPSLAEQFPKLKSLTVLLEHHNADTPTRRSQLKYTVNLSNAKSVFRFKCPNTGCIRGDFDLSDVLAKAVGKRRTTVTGELSCRGSTTDKVRCANILHYTLRLGY